jgi:hypothetical protein
MLHMTVETRHKRAKKIGQNAKEKDFPQTIGLCVHQNKVLYQFDSGIYDKVEKIDDGKQCSHQCRHGCHTAEKKDDEYDTHHLSVGNELEMFHMEGTGLAHEMLFLTAG